MKRITSLLLLLGATLSSYAQQVLTLDSCRALALANMFPILFQLFLHPKQH